MKLTLNDIKSITNGAVRVTEENGCFEFYRFTEEQEKMYETRSADFWRKTFSTSGITLRFATDSKTLKLDVCTEKSSSRLYYAFDLAVNGKVIDSLKNYDESDLQKNYTTTPCLLGDASKTFELGDGDKEITLYFPWSVRVKVKEISLDGGYIKPVKHSKKLLAFGDSITHGYDALHPSNKYITRIADVLGADEYNKAIGGEVFVPELAELRDDFTPNYITVAYGTNDWSLKSQEEFTEKCEEFYTTLSKQYPDSRIFAITPIWRKDYTNPEKRFPFGCVAEHIEEICSKLDNVTVISGFDLVPEDENLFADLRLHPNDDGFEYYFANLIRKLKVIL